LRCLVLHIAGSRPPPPLIPQVVHHPKAQQWRCSVPYCGREFSDAELPLSAEALLIEYIHSLFTKVLPLRNDNGGQDDNLTGGKKRDGTGCTPVQILQKEMFEIGCSQNGNEAAKWLHLLFVIVRIVQNGVRGTWHTMLPGEGRYEGNHTKEKKWAQKKWGPGGGGTKSMGTS
jgi:hypothetical protein